MEKTVRLEKLEKEEKTIPVICSYCNTLYGLKKWIIGMNEKIKPTHGMCKKCYGIEKKKLKI